MPGKVNETAWNRAKKAVKKEYPKVSEGTKRFYKLVMTVYKDMSSASDKPASKLEELFD